MKRASLILVLAALVGLASSAPAAAEKGATPAHSHSSGASLLDWQERWNTWAFGSSANPLLSGLCGERVGKRFFLAASVEPVAEVDCHLRPGTSLLATPAGVIFWASAGETDAELLAGRDDALATASPPLATLDGRPLDLDGALESSGVYTIPLEPGNFIQTVDPSVSGTRGSCGLGRMVPADTTVVAGGT